jgi:molybdate transport system substrate-binding protein
MLIRSLTRLALTLCAALICLAPAMAQSQGPTVLAAASLQESLSAAADRWAAKGHARPVLSFAASSTLARQIDAGAPADLFISADEEWMDYLAGRNRLRSGSRASFLTNQLVLIAPATSTMHLRIAPDFPLVRALGPYGRLAMADPDAVPAGKYGKQALITLGLWPQVRPRLAPAENVRAALMLVARGAAPLGIVYATDARAASDVRVLGLFPADSHRPIRYPLALITPSRHPDAEGFRRFLLSAEGKALFARFGFGTG